MADVQMPASELEARILGEAGLLRRIDALTQALEGLHDRSAREAAQELAQAILAYHAIGLERLLAIVQRSEEPSRPTIAALADDPLVSSLLLLHDLHPKDLRSRLNRACDDLGSTLAAQGVAAELLEWSSEVVRLRLWSTRPGGLPPEALRHLVEEAIIAAAPDVATVAFEDAGPPGSALLPILNSRP